LSWDRALLLVVVVAQGIPGMRFRAIIIIYTDDMMIAICRDISNQKALQFWNNILNHSVELSNRKLPFQFDNHPFISNASLLLSCSDSCNCFGYSEFRNSFDLLGEVRYNSSFRK
jgi:hypothetical protein